MRDANTSFADQYDRDEIRRIRQIDGHIEELLSSPEDVAEMLSGESRERFAQLGRLLFQLCEADQRSDVQLTGREAGIVMAVERFARSVAEEMP